MSLETSLVNRHWTVTVEYDNLSGDYILPLTEEILQGLDWKVGDTLVWIDNGDGSWTLKKKSDTILTKIRRPFILLYNKFFNKE